ncbi:DUF6602 domain-containing protein [Priestia sp. D51]|uniref:DUF6602 domain-containing protein n=1 Tax=Priestia megaterium TaxID=1404 RepID=UPI0014557C8E|nr:hypothetical protein [Priestia megaterium]
MASKTFDQLLDRHIKNFTEDFCFRSTELFRPNEDQRLNHSGEFGIYREELVRNFLRQFIPMNLGITTGFIIDDNSKVSTQCDVIIYEENYTPLDKEAPFIPVETVVAVGEVKSTLTTTGLKQALKKLAENKMIRENISKPTVLKRMIPHSVGSLINSYTSKTDPILRQYDPDVWTEFNSLLVPYNIINQNRQKIDELIHSYKNLINSKISDEEAKEKLLDIIDKLKYFYEMPNNEEYNIEYFHNDHITSFLICEKIDLKMDGKGMKDLPRILNEYYNELDISPHHRHNMILSLKDGIILYYEPCDLEYGNPKIVSYPKIWNVPLKNIFAPSYDPVIRINELIDKEMKILKKLDHKSLNEIVSELKGILRKKICPLYKDQIKVQDLEIIIKIVENLVEAHITEVNINTDYDGMLNKIQSDFSNIAKGLFSRILPNYQTDEHIRIFCHYMRLNSIDTTILNTETAVYMSEILFDKSKYHLE